MKGRPIAALVFVVLLGIGISTPLRDTAGGPETESTGGQKEQDRGKNKGGEPLPPGTVALDGDYPKHCLVPRPAKDELVAYAHPDGVAIGETAGEIRTVLDDTFPFRWSTTGRFLITASGTVYDAGGQIVDSLFGDSAELHNWAWSPLADCAVVTSKTGPMEVVIPGENRTTLLDSGTAGFAFSYRSGEHLAYLVESEDGSTAAIWIASLVDGTTRRVATFDLDAAAGEQIVLAGLSFDASWVFYWRGAPGELINEGTPLQATSNEGETVELETVLAHRDFIAAPIGDGVLAVVGGGPRTEANSKRLAFLEPTAPSVFLSRPGTYEISPSANSERTWFAAIRDDSGDGTGHRRLILLDYFGSPVRFPTDDPNYEDAYPMRMRVGVEVLFLRIPNDGGPPELWHFEENNPPEATGHVLADVAGNPDVSRDGWGRWVDWSADEPTSVSLVSGGS